MKRIYNPVQKKTILIVDDDQVVVHMYREKFQRQGFNVKVADNGDNVMQRLKKKEPVDLVILDLCLPGMNGVEVLKNIRSEFDVQALPVVVFSNSYLGKLERAALEAGATKCVTKTESTPSQMVQLVRELLAAGSSTPEGPTSDAAVSNVPEMLAVESETELQEKLVATILNNAPETLAKLRASHQVFAGTEPQDLRQAELGEMHRQIHSLASSTGLLGFRKIAQMANALEALLIELLAKPEKITPSVIRTIAQAIDTLSSLFDKAADSQTEILEAPKILIVDDEIISRQTICSALGKAGLAAVCLEDSLAAQQLLAQEHFDLIFLDVEMPGLTGPKLCVNIREMATNRSTPVVFVTSHSDFGSRAQSTLRGGDDFIAKPFLLVELAVKALTWLFKKNLQPLATSAAHDGDPAETGGHESPLFANHAALSLHEG
jgi:CheY-like chemotaxis protein